MFYRVVNIPMGLFAIVCFIILAAGLYAAPIGPYPRTAVYIRHGLRANIASPAIRHHWMQSNRFRTNHRDPPLTQLGRHESYRTGYYLADHTDLASHRHIYTSPLTRCIETAVCLQHGIRDRTGRVLTLRVVYALSEAMLAEHDSRYQTHIDAELLPAELVRRYGQYLDHAYPIDAEYITRRSLHGYCRAILDILHNPASIIVGHGGYMLAIYRMVVAANVHRIIDCPLNGVTIHACDKKWRLTHPTARIIAGHAPSESDLLADRP